MSPALGKAERNCLMSDTFEHSFLDIFSTVYKHNPKLENRNKIYLFKALFLHHISPHIKRHSYGYRDSNPENRSLMKALVCDAGPMSCQETITVVLGILSATIWPELKFHSWDVWFVSTGPFISKVVLHNFSWHSVTNAAELIRFHLNLFTKSV